MSQSPLGFGKQTSRPLPHGHESAQGSGDEAALWADNEKLRAELLASRQRERELRAELERLRHGLNDADVGVWQWDLRDQRVLLDPRWAERLGVAAEQSASYVQLLEQAVHAEDRASVEQSLARHLRGETPHFELEYRRRDRVGRWRWLLDRGRVVARDDAGQPLWAVGIQWDVSHYKQAELAVWESEGRFRRAFENAALGVAMGDAQENGLIIESNEALERMVGCRPGALIGRTFAELLHPDDVPSFSSCWNGLARGETASFRIEARCAREPAGSFPTRWTLSLTRDNRRRPLFALAIVEDVTERHVAERRTRAEQRLLRKLLDLQDRERRLIACEIHDGLVQDLVASKMFLEGAVYRLEQRLPAGDVKLAPALDGLGRAIDEGRRLISDLRPMVIEEMGIVEALEYLVEERSAQSDLLIDFEHDVRFDRLPQLLEGTVYRIVQEALTNAQRHAQAERVAVSLKQLGEGMELLIRDDGVGFETDRIPPERFGLRGIRERARLFGGRAAIESRPGAGTRIVVELPLTIPADDAESDADG